MGPSRINLCAVLFDVYGTLLEVGPPPAEADARWRELFLERLRREPPMSRVEFATACDKVIARHHAAARERGIAWPEVLWPSVVAAVVPAFARLPGEEQREFVHHQVQTDRTVRLAADAADLLRWLREQRVLIGIASNAQAYTVRELQEALAAHGLDQSLFASDLCFWSFEHGFSKPDPHVFQLLTTRLQARGISPEHVLMVGDRPDNDLEPARAHGWRTWHLTRAEPVPGQSGGWEPLRRHLRVHPAAAPGPGVSEP